MDSEGRRAYKWCVLDEEKECNGCGECDRCDLDPSKPCTNCMKCVGQDGMTEGDYRVLKIDGIQLEGEEYERWLASGAGQAAAHDHEHGGHDHGCDCGHDHRHG